MTTTIDSLLEELARLREGMELLEYINTKYGGYGRYDKDHKIDDHTLYALNKFFDFDDSE